MNKIPNSIRALGRLWSFGALLLTALSLHGQECLILQCPTTNLLATLPCGSNCMAVTYPAIFATNICTHTAAAVTYSPLPDYCFEEGTWPVTVTATGSGLTNTCSFYVIVEANTNCGSCLVLQCPTTNLLATLPCGSNCVQVFYPPIFATNYCTHTAPALMYSPASGTCFEEGTWPVTVTATGSGLTNTCSFSVIVQANTNCPSCLVLQCPPTNLLATLPCGSNCVQVFYPPIFATNYCTHTAPALMYSPASGTCFELGTWPVTVTATGSGLSNSCMFYVIVEANSNCAPCLSLLCPPPTETNVCGTNCVHVNYPTAIAMNFCNPTDLVVTYSPPRDYCFPPGLTMVTVTASGSGQTTNCGFPVTVVANPNCASNCLNLTCPLSQTLTLPCGSNCVPVYYAAAATNSCNPADLTLTYSVPGAPAPSGTCFGLGTTTVTVTATGSGQSTSCTFTVTVQPNPNCQSNNPCACNGTNGVTGGLPAIAGLYEFTNSPDGANPYAGLILSNNVLYGTAESGGTGHYGTVFKVNTDGSGFTTLYSFTNGNDGAYPFAGLVLSGETLYGTTLQGGTNDAGTVFAVNTDGTGFTTLYAFTGQNDGGNPQAGLVLSADGVLYGTTETAGAGDVGTVFAVSTNGTGFATVYYFTGGNDGANPAAGLVLSADGSLYGTTESGGNGFYGTVFKVSTNGTFINSYGFMAGADGAYPVAGLVLSADGFLYGTAKGGGLGHNGTVFKVSTDCTFMNSYEFTGGADGASPQAGLVLSADGFLYGTANAGGQWGYGTVFKVGTDGTFVSSSPFTGGADGASPQAGLVLSGGTLYGTAALGGTGPFGTVFALGLTNSCFQVQCPNDILVTNCVSVQEFYAPTVTDLSCSNWNVVCAPPSGSFFAPNTTNPVTCTVTDCCGHSNTCTFTVTVLPGTNCPCVPGGSWTQTSVPGVLWDSVASSADGTHLVAGGVDTNGTGVIYTSANRGVTWTQTSAPSKYWETIASSADGTHLVASDLTGGGIYTSANSGATWTLTSAPSPDWISVASSADGSHLVAAENGGESIYTSANGGATWTQTSAPYETWYSVASSADGTHLVAGEYFGGIYTSADGGVTWTQTSAPDARWWSVASSADGTHLVAGEYVGGIYTSANGGATWTQTSAPDEQWSSVASSADGTHLVATAWDGGIYTSADSGATWTLTSAPDEGWSSVASSADGAHLVAVVAGYTGGIYLSDCASCLSLVCSTNILAYLPCGSDCVPVSYPAAFATNYCNPTNLLVTYSTPSGACFGLGSTPVVVTATGSGQTTIGAFSVTVLPGTNCPPCLFVQCPAPSLTATAPCGSNCVAVTYPPALATNHCSATDLQVTYSWPSGACFPLGTTTVEVAATGSGQTTNCSFTVTVLPADCCSNSITFADFGTNALAASGLVLNGDATAPVTGAEGTPVLRLTPAAYNQAGSAFVSVHLGANDSFSTEFSFQMTNGGGIYSDGNEPPEPPGADGIVFVLADAPTSLGLLGQGVGYEGIPKSVGIKFDTWQDRAANGFPQDSDPNGNFVAVYTDGNLQTAAYVPYSTGLPSTTSQYYTPPTSMKNGDVWYAWIDYNGATGELDVRLSDGSSVRPASPQLSQTLSLNNLSNLGSGAPVYAGFTSGTGGQYDDNDILSWKFTSPCTNACLSIQCSNLVVQTCSNCTTVPFRATAMDLCCSNVNLEYYPPSNTCFAVNTTTPVRVVAMDACGNSVSNYFTVTVQPGNYCLTNLPLQCLFVACSSNVTNTLPCGVNCLPVYFTASATNECNPADLLVTVVPPSGSCFGLGTTPVTVTAIGSGQTNSCSFTVTMLPATNCSTVLCVDTDDAVKYVQEPNLLNGFDIRNNQDVLADDFVCTNRGPVTDIHLWGSWLNNQPLTNTLKFWLGIYNDVPSNANNPFSHPGTNLLWQQWFAPGQYAESFYGAGFEAFYDPVTTNLSLETNCWYYCFYPTNAFVQSGSVTNPMTYWLAAYAQLPTTSYQFGWKTTANVSNDVSVLATWPGSAPTTSAGWTTNHYGLDLAFMLTTQTNCCPVSIKLSPTDPKSVIITWPCGVLQSSTVVNGPATAPYTDVPNAVSPYTTSTVNAPPHVFYRTRCN